MTDLEKSQKDAIGANTNLVIMGLLHFFFTFFASLGYAIVLEYWKPLWIATLAAFASLVPMIIVMVSAVYGASGNSAVAIFVVYIIFGCIPPLVSFLMFRSRVMALRSRVAGA